MCRWPPQNTRREASRAGFTCHPRGPATADAVTDGCWSQAALTIPRHRVPVHVSAALYSLRTVAQAVLSNRNVPRPERLKNGPIPAVLV